MYKALLLPNLSGLIGACESAGADPCAQPSLAAAAIALKNPNPFMVLPLKIEISGSLSCLSADHNTGAKPYGQGRQDNEAQLRWLLAPPAAGVMN